MPVLAAIRAAGLKPWPKLLTVLRTTRDTEPRRCQPSHVVDAWIGHGQKVAKSNYAQITDEDYRLALQGGIQKWDQQGFATVRTPELALSCTEVTYNGRYRTRTCDPLLVRQVL